MLGLTPVLSLSFWLSLPLSLSLSFSLSVARSLSLSFAHTHTHTYTHTHSLSHTRTHSSRSLSHPHLVGHIIDDHLVDVVVQHCIPANRCCLRPAHSLPRVDVRLPGKEHSNPHGARPVHSSHLDDQVDSDQLVVNR